MVQFLKAIWLILTVNCEMSAMLTSESFERQLNFGERMAVWFHQAYCRKSRRLAAQLKMLDAKCREMRSAIAQLHLEHELRSEVMHRIRKSIRQRMGKGP